MFVLFNFSFKLFDASELMSGSISDRETMVTTMKSTRVQFEIEDESIFYMPFQISVLSRH